MNEIEIYISIFSTLLLTISEILPYVRSIKSNGVLQLVINILKKFIKNTNNSNQPIENQPIETDPLLHQVNHDLVTFEKFEQEINRLEHKINMEIENSIPLPSQSSSLVKVPLPSQSSSLVKVPLPSQSSSLVKVFKITFN